MDKLTLSQIPPSHAPDIDLKEVRPRLIRTFQFGDDPELVHFVQLGYKDRWVRIFEDAYELEPWMSGSKVMTTEEVKETFNIDLNQ